MKVLTGGMLLLFGAAATCMAGNVAVPIIDSGLSPDVVLEETAPDSLPPTDFTNAPDQFLNVPGPVDIGNGFSFNHIIGGTFNPDAQVPEPGSILLLGSGLLLLARKARRA
jgi:PEP-CTERM motif